MQSNSSKPQSGQFQRTKGISEKMLRSGIVYVLKEAVPGIGAAKEKGHISEDNRRPMIVVNSVFQLMLKLAKNGPEILCIQS